MINCSKALHLVPLVLLAGCFGAQALFSAVLVVWISFFRKKGSLSLFSRCTWLFFRCLVILAFSGFLVFPLEGTHHRNKESKRRRKMGWEERRENIKTKHQVLWIIYNALDSKEPGDRGCHLPTHPNPYSLRPKQKQMRGWEWSLWFPCYLQILTWNDHPILWSTWHLTHFYGCRVSLKGLSPLD